MLKGKTKYGFVFLLHTISLQTIWAHQIELTEIPDTVFHAQVSALSTLEGAPYDTESQKQEQTQMTSAVSRLFDHVTPRIKALSEYNNLFVARCVTIFYNRVHKILCDVDFENLEVDDSGAWFMPQLEQHFSQLKNWHMLITHCYVNKADGTYQECMNQLFFKQPMTVTKTLSDSYSVSETNAPSYSQMGNETGSLPVTLSASVSITASTSITESHTKPLPPPPTPAPTPPPPTVPACDNAAGCAYTTAATVASSPHASLAAQSVEALTWELGRKGAAGMRWHDASNYCQSKSNGWRLPTIWELYRLYQQQHVLGNDLETNTYWSSTYRSEYTVWTVSFSTGNVGYSETQNAPRVRCVKNS